MNFASREDAGLQLGHRLMERGVRPDIVLGLPRGGVVVAAEVARLLHCSLDVLAVRKIGHPYHREYALGALAEDEVMILDQEALDQSRVDRSLLEKIVGEEKRRLAEYQSRFHSGMLPNLSHKQVLIVDDGLATGATAEAAVMSVRKRGANGVVVGVPVASSHAALRLARFADQVIAVIEDPDFMAVGQYYSEFPQNTDEQVLSLLQHAHA